MVEEGNHHVQILNPDLTFASLFGSRGTENGQFKSPCDVAFNISGNIFVILRIQVFTSGGEYIWQFAKIEHMEGPLHNPQTIAIDSGDRVYVTEQDSHCITIFSQMVTLLCLLKIREQSCNRFKSIAPLASSLIKLGIYTF